MKRQILISSTQVRKYNTQFLLYPHCVEEINFCRFICVYVKNDGPYMLFRGESKRRGWGATGDGCVGKGFEEPKARSRDAEGVEGVKNWRTFPTPQPTRGPGGAS